MNENDICKSINDLAEMCDSANIDDEAQSEITISELRDMLYRRLGELRFEALDTIPAAKKVAA